MTYTIGFWVKYWVGEDNKSKKSVARIDMTFPEDGSRHFYTLHGLLHHGEVKRVEVARLDQALVVLEQNNYNPCIN